MPQYLVLTIEGDDVPAELAAVTDITAAGFVPAALERAVQLDALAEIDATGFIPNARWLPGTDTDWPADTDEDWEAQTDDRWLVSAESNW